MALVAEPVFYHTIRRNSGGRRKLIHVTNNEPADLDLVVKDVEKPEWVEIEGVFPTASMRLERGKRTPFVVNLNTDHKYFPMGATLNEIVRVVFDDDRHVLDISVALPEIVDKIPPFRGVFAIDFGTTNSVFAYKGRAMDIPHHAKTSHAAVVSSEVPSAIFFENVADRYSPRFSIGTEALFDIKENSGRTYSYIISAKRHLGLGRSVMILDRLGGKVEHRQEYEYEEIAGFVIREMLERAEEEIGQKITSVVATFPPMFAAPQKEALARAFKIAMRAIGIEDVDDALVMNLDEANAGVFNYIYGPLLDEFRDFEVLERDADLLSMDFGGGTVDISLVSAHVTRSAQGRISIETELRGLTGEANWAGDNVTLEVFKMLKMAMALAAGTVRAKDTQEQPDAAESKEEESIWDTGGGGGGGGIWDADGDEDSKEEPDAVASLDDDPEVAEIVNRDPPEAYQAALDAVAAEKDAIGLMISENLSAVDAVTRVEEGNDTYAGEELAQQRATLIDSAIETVLPTQFASYEDVDPFKMETARNLFHSLWHEADMLKLRMSVAKSGKSKMTGILKKVAKYTGVDPLAFNEIEFSRDELDVRVSPMVDRIVSKARRLYEGARGGGEGELALVDNKARPPLKVLLLGNCANLPVIQRAVTESFGAEGQTVVFDKKGLKRAVASGACEEYSLRKEFGERGLITYTPTGFLGRLPCALGIQHRDLALMGYPNGFCSIFERGTTVGAEAVLNDQSAFLIHKDMRDLAIFADYKDGAEPIYVGWIDFTEVDPENVSLDEPGLPGDAAETAEGEDAAAEALFAVKFELLDNRELAATNVQTGSRHFLKPDTGNWDPQNDPFSGVH